MIHKTCLLPFLSLVHILSHLFCHLTDFPDAHCSVDSIMSISVINNRHLIFLGLFFPSWFCFFFLIRRFPLAWFAFSRWFSSLVTLVVVLHVLNNLHWAELHWDWLRWQKGQRQPFQTVPRPGLLAIPRGSWRASRISMEEYLSASFTLFPYTLGLEECCWLESLGNWAEKKPTDYLQAVRQGCPKVQSLAAVKRRFLIGHAEVQFSRKWISVWENMTYETVNSLQ